MTFDSSEHILYIGFVKYNKEAVFLLEVFCALSLPFAGTVLGAACVFFIRGNMDERVQRGLLGFAAGVMTAASVWSLLIPAMEESEHVGKWSFFPAFAGVWLGIAFLLLMERMTPHFHRNVHEEEEAASGLSRPVRLMLAVILHNIPEGMAIGVLCAGWLTGQGGLKLPAVAALSLSLAIHNFPVGAIISMPLRSGGASSKKSFAYGVLSGAAQPVGAALMICLAGLLTPLLPYLLGFAAGVMLHVVVEDLIPKMSEGGHSNIGAVCFTAGFTVMMALDAVLG